MRKQAAKLDKLSEQEFKVLEQRARRVAKRQGLGLTRSRRRDPHAVDFGCYALFDLQTNTIIAGASSGRLNMSLREAIEYLLSDGESRRKSAA
jgi:hypothetical protein